MKILKIINKIFSIFLILLVSGDINNAQNINVPLNAQFEIIPKILSLNEVSKWKNPNEIKCAIIYNGLIKSSVTAKRKIEELAAEKQPKIQGKQVTCVLLDVNKEKDVEKFLQDNKIDLVYLMPLRAYDIGYLEKLFRKLDIISFTSTEAYLDYGISIGFKLVNERIKIVINLKSSRDEGAKFSSHLLKLAQIR